MSNPILYTNETCTTRNISHTEKQLTELSDSELQEQVMGKVLKDSFPNNMKKSQNFYENNSNLTFYVKPDFVVGNFKQKSNLSSGRNPEEYIINNRKNKTISTLRKSSYNLKEVGNFATYQYFREQKETLENEIHILEDKLNASNNVIHYLIEKNNNLNNENSQLIKERNELQNFLQGSNVDLLNNVGKQKEETIQNTLNTQTYINKESSEPTEQYIKISEEVRALIHNREVILN